MKPYFEVDGIALYHGDCLELLPVLPRPDLVLADPPYGMKYKPLRGANGSKRFHKAVVGDDKSFDPTHLLQLGRLVLWGAHWYAPRLPASGGWLVWDKTPLRRKNGFHASDADLAWTNVRSSILKFSLQWGGEAHGNEPHFHPTQKPVALMAWVLEQFTKPGDLVLDPYCGAGPTLIAAHRLRRRAVGVEIEERYCEIAARRLLDERKGLQTAA